MKMVHNGVEYGIMQAYAEEFNILHEGDTLGAVSLKKAMLKLLRMENPEDYQYDIDVPEVDELWRRGSVVGSWLLDLTAAMYYAAIEKTRFDEEYQTLVRVVGLFTMTRILAYPSCPRYCYSMNVLTHLAPSWSFHG